MALQVKLAEKPMIGRPEKLPIAALPEIPEYKIPKMSQYFQMQLSEGELPMVRRVVEAEIGEICSKILPLFQKRFPRLTLDAAVSYTRMHLNRNDARVIRTDKAWGLATVERSFFEPEAVVKIQWVAKLETSAADPMAIYADFKNWAASIRAVELHFDTMTETDISPFAKRLGFELKHVGFVKIMR